MNKLKNLLLAALLAVGFVKAAETDKKGTSVVKQEAPIYFWDKKNHDAVIKAQKEEIEKCDTAIKAFEQNKEVSDAEQVVVDAQQEVNTLTDKGWNTTHDKFNTANKKLSDAKQKLNDLKAKNLSEIEKLNVKKADAQKAQYLLAGLGMSMVYFVSQESLAFAKSNKYAIAAVGVTAVIAGAICYAIGASQPSDDIDEEDLD